MKPPPRGFGLPVDAARVLLAAIAVLMAPLPAAALRDFRGAMTGRADKGIILTTGSFTFEAQREALRDGVPPIELVDGERLVGMLEELEIGLSPIKAYRINPDFFHEFQT